MLPLKLVGLTPQTRLVRYFCWFSPRSCGSGVNGKQIPLEQRRKMRSTFPAPKVAPIPWKSCFPSCLPLREWQIPTGTTSQLHCPPQSPQQLGQLSSNSHPHLDQISWRADPTWIPSTSEEVDAPPGELGWWAPEWFSHGEPHGCRSTLPAPTFVS